MNDIEASIARSLTDDRLADDLRRIGENVRMFSPAERTARLNEAARRLDQPPAPHLLITLSDGRQIACMYGGVQIRSSVAGVWSLPINVSDTPHEPGTVHFGEW
jgi:hypothetical protein